MSKAFEVKSDKCINSIKNNDCYIKGYTFVVSAAAAVATAADSARRRGRKLQFLCTNIKTI